MMFVHERVRARVCVRWWGGHGVLQGAAHAGGSSLLCQQKVL